MDYPSYNIVEYGEYKLGDRVMHRKHFGQGTLVEMTVENNQVHMWVDWDDSILVNMHWDEIRKL